jgi:MYXO-CTERM domain-containing protein
MRTSLCVVVALFVSTGAVALGAGPVVDNGTFDTDLSSWVAEGAIAAQEAGRAKLTEDVNSPSVEISQAVTIPAGATALRFDYWYSSVAEPPTGAFDSDGFFAYLYDMDGNPILPNPDIFSIGEYFAHFEAFPPNTFYDPATVSLSGNTVELDLTSASTSSLDAQIVFAAAFWADGRTTTILIDNVEVDVPDEPPPTPDIIPEPSGVGLLGLSMAALRRKRRRA